MVRRIWSILFASMILIGFSLAALPVRAQSSQPSIIVLTADMPVEPAMQLYLERGLQYAVDARAGLIVIQLNTPGGDLNVMTNIVTALQASPIPVVVYIEPAGGMAASAGTIITLAARLAAMAPNTIIGAASPVGSQGENIDTTEATKIKEALKASVRTMAQNRPPTAISAAEDAIDNAKAYTVDEALRTGLIDIKATDLNDLLTQLNGRTVKMQNQSLTLSTSGAPVETVDLTLIEQALQLFTDPNLIFIFLSMGTLAILIELATPGGWIAGFTGAVLLLLALFGMGILPVNWFGLLFLALAFILFIVDIKAPTHGLLTAAGAASFIAGGLVLFNSVRIPGVPVISVPLVVGTGIFIALGFFAIVTVALRAQHRPILMGRPVLIGRTGVVRADLNPQGEVQVNGEAWTARPAEGEGPLMVGTRIEVVAMEGLKLKVKKVKNDT
jgi:membrane-bound serine protease (ClpP class)